MRMLLAFMALAAWAAGAAARPAPLAPVVEDDLDAEFWFDLGAREIDVTRYPAIQRRNYYIFMHSCSQCHTLARPINAPIVGRKDWTRFVDRMHVRSKTWANTVMTRIGEEAIVDFLVYDSGVRKTGKNKAAFERERKRLEELFARAMEEKERRSAREAAEAGVKEPAPYQPSPQPGP